MIAAPAHANAPPADVAVIDIGANSVRAVLYAIDGDHIRALHSHGEKPRLGRGLSESGVLQPQRILDALNALHLLDILVDVHGARRRVAFATAAVRVAEPRSRDAFITRAEAILATEVRVLSGAQEGWSAARGVLVGGLCDDGAVSDLGGLSLELADISGGTAREGETYVVGPLAVEDALRQSAAGARRAVEAALDASPPRGGWRRARLYGVGGAWRNVAKLAAAERGQDPGLHGWTLTPAEVLWVLDVIEHGGAKAARLMDKARVSNRRRETLPGAALALRALVERVEPTDIVLSETGVREGVLAHALGLEEAVLTDAAAD